MDSLAPPLHPHFVGCGPTPEPSYGQLLRLARRGVGPTGSLTAQQTAEVCRAFLVVYAQMGIG